MRALAIAVMLVAIAAPAMAQTIGSPLIGKYETSYAVYGRAIDSAGLPVRGGVAIIELLQEGVTADPLRAGINCKGDFIAEFNLLHVEPTGEVKVTVLGPGGLNNATVTAPLDPFYRRTDVLVTLGEPWGQACKNEVDVWDVSASMRVRVLNRTEPYSVGAEEIHGRPDTRIFKMRFVPVGGNSICPPHPRDETQCELFQADERGDIRYTFTLGEPFEGGGIVTLTNVANENETWSIDIDPVSRLGVAFIETSGRGPPDVLYETPGLPATLVVLAVAGVAMAFSSRRR